MTHDEMFNQLCTKFPDLITEETSLEHGVGWHNLIFNYCWMIERLVEKGICKHTPIFLIKEKFGSMRIHHSIDADGVDFEICQALQSFTENKSRYTCEKCGRFGEIDYDNGWLRCLCGECRNGGVKE